MPPDGPSLVGALAAVPAELAADLAYLRNKFQCPDLDPATGLDNEALKTGILALAERLAGQPHPVVKARAFEYLARNVRIDASPHDGVVGFGNWNRNDRLLSGLIRRWDAEVTKEFQQCVGLIHDLNRSGATMMWKDYDHSVPDWDAALRLGFAGLRERAREYRARHEDRGELAPAAAAYFDGIDITYGAILEMLERFQALALRRAGGNPRVGAVAECLGHLRQGPPRTTYEVLQFIYLFFIFGEHFDGIQVRSLGNLDQTLLPYYRRDLAGGTCDEPQVRRLVDTFLLQFASINNYWGHPFYLGGTQADGTSAVNELTYLILEEFDRLAIVTPKIQIKTAANTPDALLDLALDMIRRGNSSLVFVGEEPIRRAMMGLGYTAEEARTCDIKGCYEFSPRGKSNETGVGHINMLKPIELVLHEGTDPQTGLAVGLRTGPLENLRTFDDFYGAYIRQLGHIIELNLRGALDMEQRLDLINPSSVFSATIEHSLATGRDAFFNGCVYNNTSVLNAGFGTAVDALMAVRDVVYVRRELTLAGLRDALAANWAGHERLRRGVLRSRNRYGNGLGEVDAWAAAIARFVANKINLRPNARGGFFTASLHSAKQYVDLGAKTGATPDGRLAGEEMSKNASPTMGSDACGVTALVKSATRLDAAGFPGDFPLDVMLHPATVAGEEGLAAMRSIVRVYHGGGGIAVHFNVMDADVLLDAQQHPEKYRGLQVRVCGWNVHFTEMCRKEQDAFSRRARGLAV